MASVSRTDPPEPARHQRHPLQFSLRTLMTIMLVVGAFLGGQSMGNSTSQERDLALSEANVLVAILQNQNRYAETIPFLRQIVRIHPDCLTSRILLMRAYLNTRNRKQLHILLPWPFASLLYKPWGSLPTRGLSTHSSRYWRVGKVRH